ncbi:hypothetical protein CXG46_10735 [Nocardioides alpinus]|uniref:HTH luxR-type domain-containing protein n=1 Tax=Nocardioides alpinus TaxID=748909 RepID=A0ABX4QX74_9ACTN|nr:hypothetical protein CXG46_10735 [Nocardioides alpinus]
MPAPAERRDDDGARRSPVPGAPWLPKHFVPRPLLWSLLDEATEHPVTVVVAPAGAGKTLGVAGWLAASSPTITPRWFSATRNTPVELLEEVLDQASERAGPVPQLVVVDDAHLLPAACVRIINHRLTHSPDSVRLILLGRWDLAIDRLVPELLGHLTVLRGDVLRLTAEEAESLAGMHAPGARPEVLAAVVRRADGWCAALVLAARASKTLRHAADLELLGTSGGPIADLVAGEVFVGLRPQERHLLLCVAGEPDLTEETARHLTRDARAGEALRALESTGLLVSRVSTGPGPDGGGDPEHYRIHPLLLEVVRRRMVAGGVDVQQAVGTILRATRLDLSRGRTQVALRRFVALGRLDEAADVLVEQGPRLLAHGPDDHVSSFVRQAGPALEDHPDTWGLLALARWSAGDDDGGRHWADRFLRRVGTHTSAVSSLQLHTVRLHRARSTGEHADELVTAALDDVRRAGEAPVHDPYLALALLQVGVAENWLGRLRDAEAHLSEAVTVGRAEGLVATTAEALTHLALTQVMLGREQAALELAEEAIDLVEQHPGTSHVARTRADLVRMLVWFGTHPLTPAPGRKRDAGRATYPDVDPLTFRLPDEPDDLTSRFWWQIMHARLTLLEGSVSGALRSLDALSPAAQQPEHLRVSALMERAGLAVITSNKDALRAIDQALAESDAEAERCWVRGASADIEGDLPAAAAHYLDAAEQAHRAQPPTAVLALTCAAQLVHYLGDPVAAHALITRASEAAETRRLGSPFLGWSRHGTRVGQLLASVPDTDGSGWRTELRGACADRAGVATLFATTVATARELATVEDDRVMPTLSPRELEVLQELARGSTYGDAAANLYLSENTIKTHVSSLYTKLSVSRRSEALAVARKLHLI